MGSTNLNLVESIVVTEEATVLASPNRYAKSLEDSLSAEETFGEIHTERYSKNLGDGLAVGEVVGIVYLFWPIYNLEDSTILGEEFSESHTSRTVLSLEDIPLLSVDFAFNVNKRFDLDFEDILGLTEFVTVKGTDRSERSLSETSILAEEFLQGYRIRVVNGTIDGLSFKSFQVNDSGVLLAVPPFNWIFVRWLWIGRYKEGIQNIYSPSTTLLVPQGGGEITAEFFNLGAIDLDVKSLVIILDLFDFEYIEDPDGDYILTKETITLAGDSVGVAKTNLTIEQGAAFSRIVIYRDSNGDPVNLTGYTAKMQIRKTKDSSTTILELSTTNGRLVLGGALGTITMALTTADTDALDFVWGRYDLELYPGGDTTQAIRLLEGKVNLSKQVTQ